MASMEFREGYCEKKARVFVFRVLASHSQQVFLNEFPLCSKHVPSVFKWVGKSLTESTPLHRSEFANAAARLLVSRDCFLDGLRCTKDGEAWGVTVTCSDTKGIPRSIKKS